MRFDKAAARADFLAHYRSDAELRWSVPDRVLQRQFVSQHLSGKVWFDWSAESAAMKLMQGALTQTRFGPDTKYDALILGGPVAELLEPSYLFRHATGFLRHTGCLIGIMPCLRDNSPESQFFVEIAALSIWPYHTAEELLEMLSESGWPVREGISRFVPVPQFNQAVLKDQLAFKGFRRIFDELEDQGYDPIEVGWGELQFVATAT